MADSDDDLGDAQSRAENARYRETAERQKSANPVYAYAARWIPTGDWRMSGVELIIILLGAALIFMVLGMRLFGVIGHPR